jgi:hypothetical protein
MCEAGGSHQERFLLKVVPRFDRDMAMTMLTVLVLKPIETKNLTAADVDDLARGTRELMLQEIVKLTAKARGTTIAMPTQNSGDGIIKASGNEIKS